MADEVLLEIGGIKYVVGFDVLLVSAFSSAGDQGQRLSLKQDFIRTGFTLLS